jgi:hypothetical protein
MIHVEVEAIRSRLEAELSTLQYPRLSLEVIARAKHSCKGVHQRSIGSVVIKIKQDGKKVAHVHSTVNDHSVMDLWANSGEYIPFDEMSHTPRLRALEMGEYKKKECMGKHNVSYPDGVEAMLVLTRCIVNKLRARGELTGKVKIIPVNPLERYSTSEILDEAKLRIDLLALEELL